MVQQSSSQPSTSSTSSASAVRPDPSHHSTSRDPSDSNQQDSNRPSSSPPAVRSFPIVRTASMSGPTSPRPSRPSVAARPSYIALPPPSTHNGFSISHSHPPDVTSPMAERSVSSAESSGSRVAPDLGGSSARYFPMRTVMYPSNSSDRVTSPSATSSKRSRGGSESVVSATKPEKGGNRSSIIGRVSEQGNEDHEPVERPNLQRRNSSSQTPTGPETNGNGRHSRRPPSHASSQEKPESLDPYLPEPTTHAKIGDPDSDDEGAAEKEEVKESSRVQEHDFGDEADSGARMRPVKTKVNFDEREPASTETPSRSSSASSRPLILTSRFEHQVTEDGEILILTGREGQLMTCEDEVSLLSSASKHRSKN